MLNCFIPNNNIKFPWGSFRDNCIKHILLNISRSSPRIDLAQKDPSESIFYLLIGTSCFHFYRLEKDETKGKLFQSEICQFWGIYAREIQLVTGEMCFTPISARGIRNFSPIARVKFVAWNLTLGKFPKNIPFPWQEYQFPGRNTISLAGSSYIFEGMFPLNKRNIFFFYLIDSWAGKIKRYFSPKACMCQQLHLCLQHGNRFWLKNIDTFEVLCLLFFKFTTISYALFPTYKTHNNESPMIITEN